MSHPITDCIQTLRHAARRLSVTRALVQWSAITLGVGFLLASLDGLFRLEDVGTRVLWTLLWLAAIAWGVWRFLAPAWRARWSDQSIAKMIERRFPVLGEKLSSSVAFLNVSEADATLSSQPLMRNVISETTTSISNLKLHEAIDVRPTLKASGWLLGILALCGCVWLAVPTASSKAVSRLIMP